MKRVLLPFNAKAVQTAFTKEIALLYSADCPLMLPVVSARILEDGFEIRLLNPFKSPSPNTPFREFALELDQRFQVDSALLELEFPENGDAVFTYQLGE